MSSIVEELHAELINPTSREIRARIPAGTHIGWKEFHELQRKAKKALGTSN